jgi:glycosyltransferase involved in cell wall biosynthesis
MTLSDKICPKISIVTPSYNQGQYLEETILSVLNQKYPNLEYIIIDGGSTDDSVEIIKKYDKQLTYWASETDNGPYDAINKGLNRATGDILCYLNADDTYFLWTLRSVGEIFTKYASVQWITSLYPCSIDSTGVVCYVKPRIGFTKGVFMGGHYLPCSSPGAIQQESTFWRRTLWKKTQGLDLNYRLAGDFDLWSRFFDQTNLIGVRSLLAAFRQHPNQRSAQMDDYIKEAKLSLETMRARNAYKVKTEPKYHKVLMQLPILRRFADRRPSSQFQFITREHKHTEPYWKLNDHQLRIPYSLSI